MKNKMQSQPHSIEAEQALLGAMMKNQEAITEAMSENLRMEDFYKESHSIIFKAIVKITDDNTEVDLVSLGDELKRTKDLEQCGGLYYISGLVESAIGHGASHYIKIVKDKAYKRKLIAIGTEIVNGAFDDSKSARELIEESEHDLFGMAQGTLKGRFIEYSSLLHEVFDELDRAHNTGGDDGAIMTGYVDLDDKIAGLHNGELTVLAARPSFGKTALALNMGTNVSRKIPVAIYSMEMTKVSLAKRILLAEAGVDAHKARRGRLSNEDFQLIAQKSGEHFPIFIDDNMDLSVAEIRAKSRRIKSDKDIGLIIIDYLQLVNPGKHFDSRNAEIAYISRSFKAMAKEIDVPVLLLSQLSRAVDARKNHRPRLGDLRESGNIEQDADNVLFIYPPHKYKRQDGEAPASAPVEIIISKQRNGPTGFVQLTWIEKITKFENYAGDWV